MERLIKRVRFALRFVAIGAIPLLLTASRTSLAQQASDEKIITMPDRALPSGYALGVLEFDEERQVVTFGAFSPALGSFAAIWNVRTNRAKRLLTAGKVHEIFASPSGKYTAITTGSKSTDGESYGELFVFDQNGDEIVRLRHPQNWNFNTIYWTTDETKLLYWRDAPGHEEEGGGEEFSAIGVLDLRTRGESWFPLRSLATAFSLNRVTGLIFTTAGYREQGRIASYSIAGAFLGERPEMGGILFSPQGHYYVPWTHEAGEEWAVFDARTNKPLLRFNDRNTTEYTYGPSWNPADDDYFLASFGERTDGPLQVYRVSERRVVQKLDHGNHVAGVGWSKHGRYLIRPLYGSDRGQIEVVALRR